MTHFCCICLAGDTGQERQFKQTLGYGAASLAGLQPGFLPSLLGACQWAKLTSNQGKCELSSHGSTEHLRQSAVRALTFIPFLSSNISTLKQWICGAFESLVRNRQHGARKMHATKRLICPDQMVQHCPGYFPPSCSGCKVINVVGAHGLSLSAAFTKHLISSCQHRNILFRHEPAQQPATSNIIGRSSKQSRTSMQCQSATVATSLRHHAGLEMDVAPLSGCIEMRLVAVEHLT